MRRTSQVKTNRAGIFLPALALLISVSTFFSTLVQGIQTQQPSPRQDSAKKPKPLPAKLTSHVVLVLISGLRSDYLIDPDKNGLTIPTLGALRDQGARAQGIESVYPSLGYPALATMVTGMLPVDHGIMADSPFDEQSGQQKEKQHPSPSEIRTEMIWDAAQRAGLSTAAVGFPLAAGTAITFNQPEADDDNDRAGSAASILEKHHPNLLLVCFRSFNDAQIRYGPFSKEAAAALTHTDGLLKRIVDAAERAGIANEITFLIASDHGCAKIEREFKPNVVLAKKGLLTKDAQGKPQSWRAIAQPLGGAAAILTRDPNDEKTAREAETAFREIYEKPDSPIWRIISRRDASQLGADARVAFYLDAAPLYVMSAGAGGDVKAKATDRGATGYLPQRFEMRGALIAAGRGIRAGAKVEYARLIDIAPTIARLLGFEMKATRGRVISEILSQ